MSLTETSDAVMICVNDMDDWEGAYVLYRWLLSSKSAQK